MIPFSGSVAALPHTTVNPWGEGLGRPEVAASARRKASVVGVVSVAEATLAARKRAKLSRTLMISMRCSTILSSLSREPRVILGPASPCPLALSATQRMTAGRTLTSVKNRKAEEVVMSTGLGPLASTAVNL